MLMTEEEATKKRCTLAIPILLMDSEARNGLGAAGVNVSVNCIGSKCAQWAWYDYATAKGETYRTTGDPFAKGRQAPPSPVSAAKCVAARGYCGLTGAK